MSEINLKEPQISIEQRVARLEGKLGWWKEEFCFAPKMFGASVIVLIVSLFLSFLGLGLPNHAYQIVFALIVIALGYHRNWFAWPKRATEWIVAGLNAAVLAILFKLIIGAGRAQPFSWIRLPTIDTKKTEGAESLLNVIPDWQVRWAETALSQWMLDLTVFQTFLLLITLVGALFEFQPFISLTALLLIFVSLPSLLTFNWTWVFPAIVSAAIAFYLQTADVNFPRKRGP